MSWVQRMIFAIVSKNLASSIETESRAWMMRCDGCGKEQSVWELGGIRWKARGSPRSLKRCLFCHEIHSHTTYLKK